MNSVTCDGIRRRDFLRVGTLATGLSLSSFLRLASANDGDSNLKATADSCLFLNLAGGPAHLDTLDMKPEAPAETRGEFKSIDSALAGLQVCEYLPQFAKIADRFCLLRGISHTSGAHPQGQSYISTGNRPVQSLIYPSYGSVITKELPAQPDIPSYVAVPVTEWTPGYMGDAYAAFKTSEVPKPGKPFEVRGIALGEGMTIDRVQRRNQLLQKVDRTLRDVDTNSQLLEALDKFGQQAHQMIMSERSRSAFDVSRESPSVQKLFSEDDLGQSLLLATRLVEFGVKFVTVTNAGWDTHTDNFPGHKKLLGPLDTNIHALITAMEQKGLLERTLVIIMGEFGRTPKINENAGRDHYPRVNWCLMTGGGVKTAQIIGATDKGGTAPTDDTDISPDDIAASLYHALGIDHRKEYYTRTNRPAMLVAQGNVIDGLFT